MPRYSSIDMEKYIFGEFLDESTAGAVKYGGDDPLTHDRGHTIDEWISYIREHLDRIAVGTPMETRQELVKIGGLALSAIRAFDLNHNGPSLQNQIR